MIFSKYGEHLSPADVLDVCFEAQSEAVEAVVANNGNGPVPRLQVQYWAGNLYMSIRPDGRMRMNWLMLSHTLKGVVQFIYIVLEHIKLSAKPLPMIGYDLSPRWFLT